MKFGKLFMNQILETVPEWRDKLLSYKKLKKLIRKIPDSGNIINAEEEDFFSLFNNEIDKLNHFVIENEEELIIRFKELQQCLKRANDLWGPNGSQPSETDYKEETEILVRAVVDLHTKTILLLNICNINHRGLAKLVKKYDKKTGGGLRRFDHPLIITSELIPKLVTECENIIDEVSHVAEKSKTAANEANALDGAEPLLSTQQDAEAMVMVVKEGEVSKPNLEMGLRALGVGEYRDNFSLQSLMPLCLKALSPKQMAYCGCWRCFLYDSANELLFCLFPTCVGKSNQFEI